MRTDTVWQESAAARYFLDDVRGALPYATEQFDVMLRFIAASGDSPRRFLDLGCGDGALSAVVLARYPDADATLVDFSSPMLEAAAARLGPEHSPRLITADLACPTWREAVAAQAPFDAVVSGFAIHHLPDERKRALYGEIFALLAPGGTLVHIEHVASESQWVSDQFHAAIIDALHAHAMRRGSDVTREETAAAYAARADRDANILAPLETQCAWLRDIGFVEVVAPFRWYEIAVFGGHRPR